MLNFTLYYHLKRYTTLELIKKYFPGLTDSQLQKLSELQPLYEEWNAKINVISRKDIPFLYEKHVLHSLVISKTFSFPDGSFVMDIGTGGGFPGIPLAIVFPKVHFHLVDSRGKKIKVVDAVSKALELSNVSSEHNRADQVKHEPFDFIVTRAVAPLTKLCHWGMPLLKKPQKGEKKPAIIALKGGNLDGEIKASRRKVVLFPINDFINETYFSEKYVLVVER